jgi:uncharacterized protein YdhG (YjbR/CyaY superfamily)
LQWEVRAVRERIHKRPDETVYTSPVRKVAKRAVQEPAKGAAASSRKPKGFTDEEKAAMREAIRERQAVHPKGGADGESMVLAKIAEMKEPDRAMAKRVHEIIKANTPDLTPRTWYGMPAYANKDGNVVCFFQPAQKFKTRYSTLGFSDEAKLDEGAMWPVVYALNELTPAEEAKVVALIRKASS